MIAKIVSTITVLVRISGPFSPPARSPAYLDPGSGSFILQLVLAAFLGGLFILKGYWKKVIALFRKGKPKEGEDEEE